MRRQIKKRALKALTQMMQVVSYVEPEMKGKVQQLIKGQQVQLLKEITSLDVGGRGRYEELVEGVCDDLIENVNNQIDLYKRELSNPELANKGNSSSVL